MFGNRNSSHTKPVFLMIASVLGGLLTSASAEMNDNVSSSAVYRFTDNSEVEGGFSRSIRFDDAVAMEMQTVGLEPNAPHTVWWVVFNKPEKCSDSCNADDLLAADGTPNLNEEAEIAMLFADGAMSASDGEASFSAVLPVGRQLGEWVLGSGLADAAAAEVHLVVRSHGPIDTSRLYEQLSTYEPGPIMGGTCEVCQDHHFAVHLPANN